MEVSSQMMNIQSKKCVDEMKRDQRDEGLKRDDEKIY
jgi:hypothetical protein